MAWSKNWRPGGVRVFDGKTAAPAVTDDVNAGFLVGDNWIDETNDNSYQCQDNTAGAAVWAQIDGASGGGSGTMTTVKSDGSQVGDTDIVTLDFSDEFTVGEGPDTEINVSIVAPYSSAEAAKLSAIEESADVTDAANIASSIVGVDGKTTPADADTIGLVDSAAANALKELSWANAKATLKTYFDTLYNNYVLANHASNHTDGTDDIQDATDAVKGLATTTQITKLDGIAAGADVTGSNAPQAHKNSHDPEDGGDALDTAAPANIDGVQAAAIGSSHSLARADHIHRIQHSISDNSIMTVDGTIAENDFIKATADGYEGRTYQEATTDLFSSVLAENTQILFDPALSADGKWNGISRTGTAGTNLAFGDVVYFAVADSKWELIDADAEATVKGLAGICVVAGNEDAAVTIMTYGVIRADTAFPALTIGAPVFAGTTAGDIVVTAPSGSSDCVRVMGQAITANSILFNPSEDWIELVA